MREIKIQSDELILKRNTLAIEYKALVQGIRTAHLSLQEAKFRLLEAASDIEALKEHNSGITRRLAEERQILIRANQEQEDAKTKAKAALNVCKAVLEEGENNEYFQTLDENITIEQLEQDIDAEKSKLDYIHDGNPGALREFESRKAAIERLTAKIAEAQSQLATVDTQIATLRTKWEPELDKLIAEISAAFAHNFEQIGCAGEVGVHKDDDFDLWAIEIRVKFRENETLQLLDQHRQSGGERSVSTIFYLMALQSLARSPFRVVDEINQGMDPRNERMVHERMVDIACREHTSQYFLITPKLLTGLRYDRRMKVLCIASGEHMPKDHRTLDIRKVIANRRALMLPVR
jgi:chromosome segregation ATPase